MGHDADWSPDEPLGTGVYDALDEALDAEDAAYPEGLERSEGERSLDRQLFVDEAELDEAGVRLDDPERIVVLAGGADDPDGLMVLRRRPGPARATRDGISTPGRTP